MTETASDSRPVDSSGTLPRASAGKTALVLVLAVIVVIAATSIDAAAAHAAGASTELRALTLPVYGPLATITFLLAFLGWRIIRSRAKNPGRVLRVLVPVLTVISFVPDVALIATGFMPHASVTAVVALMFMHLIVVAVVVLVAQRIAPVR